MQGTAKIEKNNSERHLGFHIDSKLGFEKHINTICWRAWTKISALERVELYVNIEKQLKEK